MLAWHFGGSMAFGSWKKRSADWRPGYASFGRAAVGARPANPNRQLMRGAAFASVQILAVALILSFGAAAAFAAPKAAKSLTVERIYGGPSLSGYLTQGIEWSPDGKRISFLDLRSSGLEMWAMDAATGERKVLVKASVLQAVMQPEETKAIQSTGLGRVQAENYIWSPAGDALLFIGSSNLVLLDLNTMASKPLVRGTDDLEDPKFSPDGNWVSFVRGSNLW